VCHCLRFSVLAVAVVVPESRVARCVHCEEDVGCLQATSYISERAHGGGCWQIYYFGVYRATVAAFPLNFKQVISSKTKYAVTLHSRLT